MNTNRSIQKLLFFVLILFSNSLSAQNFIMLPPNFTFAESSDFLAVARRAGYQLGVNQMGIPGFYDCGTTTCYHGRDMATFNIKGEANAPYGLAERLPWREFEFSAPTSTGYPRMYGTLGDINFASVDNYGVQYASRPAITTTSTNELMGPIGANNLMVDPGIKSGSGVNPMEQYSWRAGAEMKFAPSIVAFNGDAAGLYANHPEFGPTAAKLADQIKTDNFFAGDHYKSPTNLPGAEPVPLGGGSQPSWSQMAKNASWNVAKGVGTGLYMGVVAEAAFPGHGANLVGVGFALADPTGISLGIFAGLQAYKDFSGQSLRELPLDMRPGIGSERYPVMRSTISCHSVQIRENMYQNMRSLGDPRSVYFRQRQMGFTNLSLQDWLKSDSPAAENCREFFPKSCNQFSR